jgi:hypothetical protein
MADTRRGKKTNTNKNYVAAKDFADGKKIGRKKQVWVPNDDPNLAGKWMKI